MSNRVFSLYMAFMVLLFSLDVFGFVAGATGFDWNLLSVGMDNFVVMHVSMFMVLRLIKLRRLRYVVWYFVVVCMFASIYQGNNRLFYLTFENVFDLSCIKHDLFFPIMMLPISNYYSSMTFWMCRVLGGALALVSLLPLEWGVRVMVWVYVMVLLYEIKNKGL